MTMLNYVGWHNCPVHCINVTDSCSFVLLTLAVFVTAPILIVCYNCFFRLTLLVTLDGSVCKMTKCKCQKGFESLILLMDVQSMRSYQMYCCPTDGSSSAMS